MVKKPTVADQWCDIYTFIKYIECKHAKPDPKTGKKPTRPLYGFINLSPMIKHREMMNDPEKTVFAPNMHPKIVDINGFPHLQCKYRFVNSIRRHKDDVYGIYYSLLTYFKPDAIKVLWPDIVLLAHNQMARKQQRREFCEHRAALKKIPIQDRKLHKEVERLTQNKSATTIARERRELSR